MKSKLDKKKKSRHWWYAPVIPALGRWRQSLASQATLSERTGIWVSLDGIGRWASLDGIGRCCFNTNKNRMAKGWKLWRGRWCKLLSMTISSPVTLRAPVKGSQYMLGYDKINQTDQTCQVLEESLSFWQTDLCPNCLKDDRCDSGHSSTVN